MMVRKLLKAAIYIKVIVVTTLVTIHEPMADEVMDEFVTSERTVINNVRYEFDENGVWISE